MLDSILQQMNSVNNDGDVDRLPKWQRPLARRGILQEALVCGWKPSRNGWTYQVCDLEGCVIATRWKNSNSNVDKGKYTWPSGKLANCKYYIPPNTDLRAAIKNAGGVVYIASGEPDLLAYRSAGFFNVICWFGEDAPPLTLAADFQALGVKEVRYLPDLDATGQKSAQKVGGLLQGSDIAYHVYALPSNLGEKGDINRLWQQCNFDHALFGSCIEEIFATEETHVNLADTKTSLFEPVGNRSQPQVDWDTERQLWVQTVVMPQLDLVAPVRRREGKRERRHCPNPSHPDQHPSFSISFDRDTTIGIPQCSCGIQDEERPWDKVAEWVGVESFKSWWKREQKSLYANHTTPRQRKAAQFAPDPTETKILKKPKHVSAPPRDTNQLTKDLAEAILADAHFASDRGGKLYYFSEGYYQPGGERRIKQLVKKLLNTWKMGGHWTTHRANEVAGYIQIDAPQLWEIPPIDTLNVRNGLIDTATLKLRPHDPNFLSQIQLPIEYVFDAYPHYWDSFCKSVFPLDAYDAGVHWQILAWLMLPITSLQKALLLLGDGGNGKSRYLAGVRAFLGIQNVTALSLQKIENDRFAVARLLDKLANICPDLPSQHLEQTAIFKQLTGDDGRLTGEFKGKDSFEFSPFARLVFSTNQPPISRDNSEGFYRRWIILPFTRTFSGSEHIDSRQIDSQLSAPGELSGVLNMALKHLAQVMQHGITETISMKQALADFRQITDPIAAWFDQETFLDASVYISQEELWQACNRAIGPITRQKFGRDLKRLRPQVKLSQRSWESRSKTRIYLGIGCQAGLFKRLD